MIKVIVKENKQIYGLTTKQKKKIKHELTFINPMYLSAKKFSRRPQNVSVDKYIFLYKDNGAYLTVPVGFNIPFDKLYLEDNRIENTVSYAPFKLKLRETQKEAYLTYLQDTDKGTIVLPTGVGKSLTAIYIAYSLRQKTLVIVHKDDLIDGWNKDIKLAFNNKVKPGLIKAKSRKVGKQITLATVQTLSRLNDKEFNNLTKQFGLVIIDECLVGDTLVTLDDGGFKQIKDIKNNQKVLGGKVANKFSRMSSIYRVESTHSILEGSPTHPTFILDGSKVNKKSKNVFTKEDLELKCLKDVKKGDYIPIINKLPHTVKYNWTKDQLSFVAMIMVDGHLDKALNSRRIKVNITKDQEWYRNIFKKGINSFEKIVGKLEIKESYDCRNNLTLWVNSNELRNILKNTFKIPYGKKSNKLIIPEMVMYSPLESIQAFIETLFNCEGDFSITKNSRRINIGMCSKLFIQGLSLLLKKFNILSNYQEIVKYNNHNSLYRISCGGINFNKFMNTFNLIDRKNTEYRNIEQNRGFNIGDYTLVRVKKSFMTTRKEKVYDYTTTSHTFIANGCLTHNCHHTPANSYSLINKFPAQYKIGLTATDERKDGLDELITLYLGDVCYRYKAKRNDKNILPGEVHIKVLPEVIFYPHFQKKGKSWRRCSDKLGTAINKINYKYRPRINYTEIDDFAVTNPLTIIQVTYDIKKEVEQGHSCLIFFKKKDHIKKYAEVLKEMGYEDTLLLYYGDSKMSKEEMKGLAESRKKLITLATYSIATEGTNVKSWEVCFLVGNISDGKNVEQAVGRVRRIKEGKIKTAKVYDYRFPNVYSLGGQGKERTKRYRELKFKIINDSKRKSIFC